MRAATAGRSSPRALATRAAWAAALATEMPACGPQPGRGPGRRPSSQWGKPGRAARSARWSFSERGTVGGAWSVYSEGRDGQVDGLDADEGGDDPAQAVDQEVAAQHCGCAERAE